MYVIIETGGKQYRVQQGDIIDVELLKSGNDKTVSFPQILFYNDGSTSLVGQPHLNKCIVMGEILEETKGPKVIAYKYKKRKNYRRKVGHRQKYSRVKITEIKKES